MKYAIIHAGLIENITEWDGESSWSPPEGRTLLPLADDAPASIGWAVKNNTVIVPPPPDPGPPPVPTRASAGRFMQALVQLGHYTDLKNFVDAYPAPKGDELRVLWVHAIEYNRNDPDLIAVAHAVGMTDADIDAVFVQAGALLAQAPA